jgi:hypothetical protein
MQPQLMSRVLLGIVATALPLVAALSLQNRSLRALLRSCVAMLLLAACDPGDMVLVVPDGQTSSGPSIRVLVVRPDGEPAAHAVVYFQLPDPYDTTLRSATTDSAGFATLAGLRQASLYWIAAELDDPVLGVLGGGEKAYPETEVTVSLAAPRAGGIVISEVYMNEPIYYTGERHEGSKYVEIANNGDEVIYLDGMLIGKVYGLWQDHGRFGHSRCEDTELFRRDPAGVWSNMFWRFPGSGGQHPLAPGGVAVIAVQAADHRQIHPSTLDLSGADFEFGYASADNPAAPNMISAGPYAPGTFGSPFSPFNNFWFIAGAADVETFPLAADPGMAAGQPPMWFRRIPAELLHDVAFVWMDAAGVYRVTGPAIPCIDPVHPDFDRIPGGFVHPNQLELSAHRRRIMLDGRARLLDTNTSRVDFREGPRTPGRLP